VIIVINSSALGYLSLTVFEVRTVYTAIKNGKFFLPLSHLTLSTEAILSEFVENL